MVLAYVLATVYGNKVKVAEALTKFHEVSNIHLIYGEYDIIMTIKAKDLIQLRESLMTKIERIEGIGRTTTFIVADRTKELDNVPNL